MTAKTIGLTAVLTVGLLAGSASAQDEPRLGITMGYPTSIGLIWHVSDRVALRPEIDVQKRSSQATSSISISIPSFPGFPGNNVTETTVTTIDSWQTSVGVSALFYLSKGDALRTYIAPRYGYSRSSSDASSSEPDLEDVVGIRTSTHTVSGSFGAQYAIARRFSVFGEIGAAFSRAANAPQERSSSAIVTSSSRLVGREFGVKSAVGVILYF